MKRAYKSDGLTVTYDADVCIHAAVCVGGLPAVFDTRRRPWIRLDLASADEIVAVVGQCPSGAVEYTRDDGPPQEAADAAQR